MFKKILITDSISFKKSGYKKIISIEQSNVNLVQYFMTSHKKARKINKKILEDNGNSELLLSLLKLSDRYIFECVRILEMIEEHTDDKVIIDIDTKYNKLLSYIARLEKINLNNVNILNRNLSIKKYYSKYFFGWNLMLLNSFFIKKTDDKNIFCIYNDKISYNFARPYKEDSLVYASFSSSLSLKPQNYIVEEYIKYKFIVPIVIFKGFKNILKNKTFIKKLRVDNELKRIFISNLFALETKNMLYLSLKIKYKKLENLIGLFDADSTIDYATKNLNSIGVQTICIPHGINFKYKANYISYGTNIYTFWSKDHLKRMNESTIYSSKQEKLMLTGNIVYTETMKHIQKNKKTKKILVVGEYFSSDIFYGSPFNYQSAKLFFDTLNSFMYKHRDCEITIRTRINDKYTLLAKKYLSKRIKLSSPESSLIEEINEHDLIISVFSNALHEALLLNKKVLQVNLLGIENYRNLAQDGLVHYADTKELLEAKLEDWYMDKLVELNYGKHLEKYCNSGIFSKIKLESL